MCHFLGKGRSALSVRSIVKWSNRHKVHFGEALFFTSHLYSKPSPHIEWVSVIRFCCSQIERNWALAHPPEIQWMNLQMRQWTKVPFHWAWNISWFKRAPLPTTHYTVFHHLEWLLLHQQQRAIGTLLGGCTRRVVSAHQRPTMTRKSLLLVQMRISIFMTSSWHLSTNTTKTPAQLPTRVRSWRRRS